MNSNNVRINLEIIIHSIFVVRPCKTFIQPNEYFQMRNFFPNFRIKKLESSFKNIVKKLSHLFTMRFLFMLYA